MDIQDVINHSEGKSLLLSHFSPFCDVCGIVSLIFQDYLLLATTVHSYIYAGTLNSPQTNSSVDLNELHRLKINLEDLIKQYSESLPLSSATNKSRLSLSDSVSSNQLLTAENKNIQNGMSTIRPSHERSTTSAEEDNKLELSGSTVWPYPINFLKQ